MKDIGASIKTIYSTLLSGITYNSVAVPLYTEEPFETTPDNYIVLLSTDQNENNNDQRFANEVVQTIDIVTKENMRNSRTAVDAISNSVLQALLPSSFVYREDSDFEIFIISASSPGYIHTQDGSIHINRKLLRIVNRLTQK